MNTHSHIAQTHILTQFSRGSDLFSFTKASSSLQSFILDNVCSLSGINLWVWDQTAHTVERWSCYLLLSAVKVSVQQPRSWVLMNSSVNNIQWQQFPTLSVFMREIVSFLIKWIRINQAAHCVCVSEEEVITLEHTHARTHIIKAHIDI